MKRLFYNAVIVGENDIKKENALLVENGKIAGFISDPALSDSDEAVDCRGGYVLPGFIDIHVHGGGGADFMDGSVDAIERVIATHLSHGTTTICPTTMSVGMDEIENVFSVYRTFKATSKYASNALGLHLEGPFLSPKMVGAQRPDLIIAPTAKEIAALKDNSDIISRVSCAPEVAGVMKMASEILPSGVQFSMGHTNATYEQAEDAYNSGFTSITHLYSATSGFHKVDQRVHIGVTQAAFGVDGLYAELIGDGCHVPKELLRLAVRFKGVDKICLVTDAMRATGTNVSESYLGKVCPENRVIIDDGVAKLPDKSSFAGSIGTMDGAFTFAVEKAKIPLVEAAKLVSLTPAKLMGISDKKGSLETGKDADLVITNENLRLERVFVGGERVV